MLAGLLLAAALMGTARWNSERLNATEQELVGAWESVTTDDGTRTAMLLLPDGRMLFVAHAIGQWGEPLDLEDRWDASPGQWTYSRPRPSNPPGGTLWDRWIADIQKLLGARMSLTNDIVILTPEKFGYRAFNGPTHMVTRSRDPELLRMLDRLSAGESQ